MSAMKDMASSGSMGLLPMMMSDKGDGDSKSSIPLMGFAPLTINALKKKKPDQPKDDQSDLTDSAGPFG